MTGAVNGLTLMPPACNRVTLFKDSKRLTSYKEKNAVGLIGGYFLF